MVRVPQNAGRDALPETPKSQQEPQSFSDNLGHFCLVRHSLNVTTLPLGDPLAYSFLLTHQLSESPRFTRAFAHLLGFYCEETLVE